MENILTILEPEYRNWVITLKSRYRRCQIKTALGVNREMLRFYWELGRDIAGMQCKNNYGQKFYKILSADLKKLFLGEKGFSPRTIRYAENFYLLYSSEPEVVQQLVAKLEAKAVQQIVAKSKPVQKSDENNIFFTTLFSIPWGHHTLILDKVCGNVKKAIFYVLQTIEQGWSRSMLLNFLDSQLYERQGRAQTNFLKTLPTENSDLAQELLKDPYNFAFTGITGKYNEKLLKNALLENITKFLLELGTGFAYVGREYCLQIGETENFIDLLFYNLRLRCYVVIEVKIDKFEFADMGQLSGYVVACNHLLKTAADNPTIGLLICKTKDNTVAQYALEATAQPIGISEYELAKLYPAKIEGAIPTIEELETQFSEK